MKNKDLFQLAEHLKNNIEHLKNIQGAKLTFTIVKNMDLIDIEINSINSILEPTTNFNKFSDERVELCEKFVKRDENQNIMFRENNSIKEFDIDETNEEWIESINNLKNTYNDDIKYREGQINDYNKKLDEVCEIEFDLIDLDSIDNNITLEQMLIIKHFIKS